jgi:hypothetical protein
VNFTASPNYTVTGRIVFSDGTGTPKVTLREALAGRRMA